ncbi:MAG: sigma 54 modulation/S30EA ribosomal C-terminal domain-containing protein, partial [Streptomycetaceae bacterium]|nr:sigma 54 modulation/S30EA ribosomal C-terminal domain-containing protein [Streptomycetaceae bacterium]
LERLRRDRGARLGTPPGRPRGDAGHHDGRPTNRPVPFPRPPHEREIVRHKSFALARETPDEAAFEMDAMDYDFHLFTDLGTGQDSVIYRAGPTGLRLAQVQPRPDLIGPLAVRLTVSPTPAPRLRPSFARRRLDASCDPFVFFTHAVTGRGNVLYRRYDGHYGLITPAA